MKSKILISTTFTAFCALPMLIACGSSGVSSGVDGTKTGSALTGEETKKVCNAYFDYSTSQLKGVSKSELCQFSGVTQAMVAALMPNATDASVQTACQSAVDTCNNATGTDGGGGTTGETDPCVNVTTPVTDCSTTVADFETCLTEYVDDTVVGPFKNAPACNTLTVTYYTMPAAKPAPSPACVNARDNCANGLLPLGVVIAEGGTATGGSTGSGGATGTGGADTATGGADTATGGADTGSGGSL